MPNPPSAATKAKPRGKTSPFLNKTSPPDPRWRAFLKWLAAADTLSLLCRDQGHWWPDYGEGSRWGARRDGVWMMDQVCTRGCKVERRRFLAPEYSLAGGSSYNYTLAPGYRVPPEALSLGGHLDKARRAAIRKELRERYQNGESA